mmetsp:Transcript_23799/g.33318  ORF Transcript_23799/g.33318 Transcript_23799/m.33318 type:complete len:129 (+) Transcript_23799:36-422(+)
MASESLPFISFIHSFEQLYMNGDSQLSYRGSGSSPPLLYESQRQTKTKFPVKTLLLCLVLTTIGAVFIPIGVWQLKAHGLSEALPFFILGSLGALPGFFHLFIFVKAYLGHKGYTYEQIPGAYDEVHS